MGWCGGCGVFMTKKSSEMLADKRKTIRCVCVCVCVCGICVYVCVCVCVWCV